MIVLQRYYTERDVTFCMWSGVVNGASVVFFTHWRILS